MPHIFKYSGPGTPWRHRRGAGGEPAARAQRGNGGEVTDAAVKLAIEQSRGRDELAKELASRPATPATASNPISDLKTLAEVVRSLQPAAPAADKVDLVAILRDELIDLRKQLSEDRAEQRRLQQELFQAKTTVTAAPDPVASVTSVLDTVSRIRKIIPDGAATGASADSADGWLAFLSGPAGSALINNVVAPITSMVMHLVSRRLADGVAGSSPNTTPAVPLRPEQSATSQNSQGAQSATPGGSAGAPAPSLQPSLAGVVNAITPMMLKWLNSDSPADEVGADLAELACEQSSLEDLQALQNIGAQNIVGLYSQTPVWLMMAPMETRFRQVVEAFVKWTPPPDDEADSDTFGGEDDDDREIV